MPSFTITVTAPQAQRVATDVGGILGHPGVDATAQEVHDWMWGLVKTQCMNWEMQQAHQAVTAPTDLGNST